MDIQSNSDPKALAHDFGVFIQYVADEKIPLTPKQFLIPLRHIRAIMERFQVQEPHEHRIGDLVFKTRHELEYMRFYFLDLLAVGGSFLKITKKRLVKGPYWKSFFEASEEERPFLLLCAFRDSFNFENWFMRGGDFGEQIEEKASAIWSRMMSWSTGEEIHWNTWAIEVIRFCDLRWGSIDQTHAKEHAVWGLEYCFLTPLRYFGLLEVKQDEKSHQLQSFHLNQIGCDYFKKLSRGALQPPLLKFHPFSLN